MKKPTILLICVALVICVSLSSSVMASDEEDVLQVAINWTKAFSNADFESMSSLYLHSPKTSEFGPVSGYPLLFKGWDQCEKAWKSNMSSIELGALSFSIHNPEVALIGKDAAVTAVYQIAVYTDPETKVQTVGQLRQTLVLEKVNGQWLIVHHHSSNFPME